MAQPEHLPVPVRMFIRLLKFYLAALPWLTLFTPLCYVLLIGGLLFANSRRHARVFAMMAPSIENPHAVEAGYGKQYRIVVHQDTGLGRIQHDGRLFSFHTTIESPLRFELINRMDRGREARTEI